MRCKTWVVDIWGGGGTEIFFPCHTHFNSLFSMLLLHSNNDILSKTEAVTAWGGGGGGAINLFPCKESRD